MLIHVYGEAVFAVEMRREPGTRCGCTSGHAARQPLSHTPTTWTMRTRRRLTTWTTPALTTWTTPALTATPRMNDADMKDVDAKGKARAARHRQGGDGASIKDVDSKGEAGLSVVPLDTGNRCRPWCTASSSRCRPCFGTRVPGLVVSRRKLIKDVEPLF